MHLNFEWKASIKDKVGAEEKLLTQNPLFIGEDHQTDTYFNVPTGRLKLREGNIENALIHYDRKDEAGAKESHVILYQHMPDPFLKDALTAALGVKVIVQKRRRIYFIDNVKFHFDHVDGLGTFAEVEAIDKDGTIGIQQLKEQSAFWAHFFNIKEVDFIASSYSDMLLKSHTSGTP